MKEKQISVIIPCYNAAGYIDRCMKSLTNQTIGMEALEIILINDGSTDDTYEKLLQWEEQYSEQILVINFENNRKLGTARNIGMQYATGEYIGFCDADDWIEPTMYETLLTAMEKDDYDLVQCGATMDTAENYLPKEKRRVASDFVLNIVSVEERKKLILQGILSGYPWNKLYRKKFLIDNEIEFLNDRVYEDNIFLGLLNLYTKKALCVGEKLYHYFQGTGSILRSKNAAHHLDIFEAGTKRLLEYKVRNIFEEYKDELEYEFLEHNYFEGIWKLIRHWDSISYECFLQIQRDVVAAVPDYRKNPYFLSKNILDYRRSSYEGLDEVRRLLLDLLDKDIPQDLWLETEKALRMFWNT